MDQRRAPVSGVDYGVVISGLPAMPERYHSDPGLQRLLRRSLSEPARAWAEPVLQRMGEASAGILEEWAALADRHPPRLHPRDRFGNRVDLLEFHPAYTRLQEFAYGQGIVGAYYDPAVREQLGHCRETVKFAQGYLFSQAEQGLYCPICMTDGTAYLVETCGNPDQQGRFLPRLTSKELGSLWEGAMFLTEKAGGSDVGACETLATPVEGSRYALSGEKWFCSNAGAELVMVLARPPGARPGTSGLGLFALRRHLEDGSLNHLHLERLKEKLGTRSMPTGEVLLRGSLAEPLGNLEHGFAHMTDMLNLSRLYNATAAVALMRRCVTEAVRYAVARHTFGRSLLSYPMVRSTLVELAVEQEAALHLLFALYEWRGRASESQLLRLFTPLAKLTTGRAAVATASQAVELHGGCGYIEDWPLARLLRDAQVLPIWEGTTFILALDALRSLRKEQCHEALFAFVAEHNQDRGVAQASSELQAGLPREDNVLPWCLQATRVFQAALLQQSASEERSSQVAEYYLRRHFAPDSQGLSPGYLEYAWENHELLLAHPF